MGFKSWLTGRNDLYADKDKIDDVLMQLEDIKGKVIEKSNKEISKAIKQLNSCTGFQEYVSTSITADSFEPVIEAATEGINVLTDEINKKVDSITEYSESSIGKKFFSTLAMAGAKLGEGVLSVGEDLGDGVVSVVGWVAPKDSGLEKSCEKFIKKQWSHDAFNFYYKSDFAKASAFTEDSAAAAGFKIAGSTAGYLALGAATGGLGAGIGTGARAASIATKGGRIAKVASTAGKASKTTAKALFGNVARANTTNAVLTGMGSGAESALYRGESMNAAFRKGVMQGAAQGALAFGAGKLGQRIEKKNAIKAAEKELKVAKNDPYLKVLQKQEQQAAKVVEQQKGVVKKAEETFNSASKNAEAFTKKARSIGNEAEKLYQRHNKLAKELENIDDMVASGKYLPGEEIIGGKRYVVGTKEMVDATRKSLNNERIMVGNKATSLFKQGRNIQNIPKTAENRLNIAKGNLKTVEAQHAGIKAELQNASKGVTKAKANLNTVKKSKLSSYDGYTDRITKGTQKAAKNAGEVFEKGTRALSDTVQASAAIRAKAADAGIKSAAASQSTQAFKQALGKAAKGTSIGKVIDSVKTYGVVETLKDAPGAVLAGTTGAGAVAASVVMTPGGFGALLNATGREVAQQAGNAASFQAGDQVRETLDNYIKGIEKPNIDYSGLQYTDSDTTMPDSSTNQNTSDYTDGYSGTTSGGTSDGGTSGSSSSGGNYRDYVDNNGKKSSEEVSDKNPKDTNNKKDDKTSTTQDDNKNKETEKTTETKTEEKNENDILEEKPVAEDTKTTADETTENTATTDSKTTAEKPESNVVNSPRDTQTVYHTGGETADSGNYPTSNDSYSDGGSYYTPEEEYNSTEGYIEPENTTEGAIVPEDESVATEPSDQLDDMVSDDYTKIPSNTPTPSSSSSKGGGSAVIPIAAGLSAAAAAGIGAKAYMDRKKNNENGEEIETEEWDGDDSLEIDYDNNSSEEQVLDNADDYVYQEPEVEKYDARNNEELADLQ